MNIYLEKWSKLRKKLKDELNKYINDPDKKEEANRLFEKEAEILSRLDHPNIPKIVDHFAQFERQYLVMECVEGKTLQEIIDSRETVFDEKEAIELALQICSVLSYLHAGRLDRGRARRHRSWTACDRAQHGARHSLDRERGAPSCNCRGRSGIRRGRHWRLLDGRSAPPHPNQEPPPRTGPALTRGPSTLGPRRRSRRHGCHQR